MTVLLALVSALAYGLSDFVGGVASKRVTPWSVALSAQLAGAVAVLLLSLRLGGSPTGTDLSWAVLGGLGNGFGTAFLYRGLSAGRMGVVAPISAVGAALVPVVVGLVADERPGALVWVGLLAALPGIWLVSREPGTRAAGAGVGDGVLAGLGFGTLFATLGQVPEEAGFLPLALNQVVGGITIIVVASALRRPWLPRDPRAAIGALSGLLGATATGAFLVATHHGLLTVTAVITSLYPAVTVVLAAAVLREHVHRAQAAGLGLCAVAVALVAAG